MLYIRHIENITGLRSYRILIPYTVSFSFLAAVLRSLYTRLIFKQLLIKVKTINTRIAHVYTSARVSALRNFINGQVVIARTSIRAMS